MGNFKCVFTSIFLLSFLSSFIFRILFCLNEGLVGGCLNVVVIGDYVFYTTCNVKILKNSSLLHHDRLTSCWLQW